MVASNDRFFFSFLICLISIRLRHCHDSLLFIQDEQGHSGIRWKYVKYKEILIILFYPRIKIYM